MKFNSNPIDDACEQVKGHTNWAYFDTLDKEQQKKVLKGEMVIVFFDEPANEDGEHNY